MVRNRKRSVEASCGTSSARVVRLRLSGFKYGLINTKPLSTTAIFRSDTYGQFRDMLEQRSYSRLYEDEIDQDTGIVLEEKLLNDNKNI